VIAYAFVPPTNLVLRTWIASLSSMVVLWVYVLYRHNGRLPLRSDVLVVGGFSLLHLLPPLYISLRLHSNPDLVYVLDKWHLADSYALSILFVTIGVLSFFAGYDVIARQFRHNIASAGTEMAAGRLQVSILIAMVAGTVWLARIYRVSVGGYYWAYKDTAALGGQWFSLTGQISAFGLLIPIILWLLAAKDKRWFLWAILATVLEFAWIVPSGARMEIGTAVLGIVMVTWWHRRHIPWKTLAVLFMIALIIMPIIGQYRYTVRQFVYYDQIDLSSTLQAYLSAQERHHDKAGEGFLSAADVMMSRFHDGAFFLYNLENFRDRYNWFYGETYTSRLPFIFIPYFVYPDRPPIQVHLQEWFPHLISGGDVPATFLGEAYMNFGFWGILIMPLFLGGVLALWDVVFVRYSHNPFMVAVYILYCTKIAYGATTAGFAATLGGFRNYILLAGVLAFAFQVLAVLSRKPSKPEQI
jgi:hypothetical protein